MVYQCCLSLPHLPKTIQLQGSTCYVSDVPLAAETNKGQAIAPTELKTHPKKFQAHKKSALMWQSLCPLNSPDIDTEF